MPHTAWGRVLGSVVIVVGVTFVSVLFATVTSFLISTDQDRERETHELLRSIASRLDTIEAELATIKGAARHDVT